MCIACLVFFKHSAKAMAMQQLQYHPVCLLTLIHEQNEILHNIEYKEWVKVKHNYIIIIICSYVVGGS